MKYLFSSVILMGILFTQHSVAEAILFVKSDVQVGSVREGGIKTFVFEIENVGNSELIIKEIRKSCGCTSALLETDTIAPNQTSKMTLIYHHEKVSNRFSSSVVVLSNSLETPHKILKIEGDVYNDNFLLPSVVELTKQIDQKEINGFAKFDVKDDSKFEIIDYNVSHLYKDERLTDHSSLSLSKKDSMIYFSYDDMNLKPGRYISILNVILDSGDSLTEYKMPVNLDIISPVTFFPNYLNVTTSTPSSELQSRILIKHIDEVDLKIQSIESPVDWIKSSVKKIKDNAIFLYLNVSVPEQVTSDKVSIVIKVKINEELKDFTYDIVLNPS